MRLDSRSFIELSDAWPVRKPTKQAPIGHESRHKKDGRNSFWRNLILIGRVEIWKQHR